MGTPKRAGMYLRVSTHDQNTSNQRRELERVAEQRGWEVVRTYEDQGVSGAKGRDLRPGFDRLCRDAARGRLEVVMVWAIDRLGRSLSHVAVCLDELRSQNVATYIHQQGVDGTTPSGKAMLGMAAVFAEFERDMLRERIAAGISRARAEGRHLGRPRTITREIELSIVARRSERQSIRRIARELGVGVGTVQRAIAARS